MHIFKNILIDVNALGATISPALLTLIQILKVEKIFFYYYYVKTEVGNEKQQLENADVPELKDDYNEKLKLFFNLKLPENLSVQYELIVLQDELILSILKASMKYDIDLLCFEYEKGAAKKEEIIKIAKNSFCSVLVLPEVAPARPFKKILLPFDFSSNSKKVFELALEIFNDVNIAFILNHVYFVPAGYHATGKSYEESAILEKQGAKKECQKFLKDYDLFRFSISYSYILDDDKDPTDKIFKDAVDNQVDLIIMGAKGKTNSPATLTGSTAFGLLLYNQELPMLLYRNKKNNYDLAEEALNKPFISKGNF